MTSRAKNIQMATKSCRRLARLFQLYAPLVVLLGDIKLLLGYATATAGPQEDDQEEGDPLPQGEQDELETPVNEEDAPMYLLFHTNFGFFEPRQMSTEQLREAAALAQRLVEEIEAEGASRKDEE